MRPAIFIDRDGVINVDNNYVHMKEDFKFIDGSLEALQNLSNTKYLIVIVTSQSGIGRGLYTEDDYRKLEGWMLEMFKKCGVRIDAIYYCPHHPEATVENYRVVC